MKTRVASGKFADGRWPNGLLYLSILLICIFCTFQLEGPAWADYLLSLKSGLQMRVRTYHSDGATMHVWTDSGSMGFPIDLVTQINEIKSITSDGPQIPSKLEKETVQSVDERARETLPRQGRENPLYVPGEQKSP
jgi:hypothetical protein